MSAGIQYIESCCPRKPPPPPNKPPDIAQPPPRPPDKPDEPSRPPSPDQPPDTPLPPGGGTTPGISPTTPFVSGPTRPSLGIGLQPLIQSLGGLANVVEPWEAWWSRNRDRFLSFRDNIEWMKIVDEGGTQSVSIYPIYEELFKVLEESLYDKDQYLAFRSAIALGKAQDSQNPSASSLLAIEILKKANDKETRFFIRNNVLLGLGLTGDGSSSAIIKDVFKSKEPFLRRAYAGLALGFIQNDPEILTLIKDVISEKDDIEVKATGCISLGNLKDNTSVSLLGKILNSQEGVKKEPGVLRAFAALGLGRIGTPEALGELKKITPVSEKEVDVRSAVVIALGLTGLPEANEPLVQFIQDKNNNIKGLAVIALAQLKDSKAYEIISEALKKNRSQESDGAMVLALGLSGDEKAKPDLRKILEDKKSRLLLKSAAAIGLGLLKDTEATPIIVNILNKQQNDVILTPYLILSLGMIGDQKGTEVLQKIWNKTDKNLTQSAYTNLAVALTMLGKRDEVKTRLNEHINSKDETLVSYALHTLGLIGNKESAQIIVNTYKNKDNPDVRRSAVVAIGFLLDKEKVNPLNKVTADNIDIQMQIMNHILPIPVW